MEKLPTKLRQKCSLLMRAVIGINLDMKGIEYY